MPDNSDEIDGAFVGVGLEPFFFFCAGDAGGVATDTGGATVGGCSLSPFVGDSTSSFPASSSAIGDCMLMSPVADFFFFFFGFFFFFLSDFCSSLSSSASSRFILANCFSKSLIGSGVCSLQK